MLSAISKIFPKALKKKICEKRLSSIETLPTQSARYTCKVKLLDASYILFDIKLSEKGSALLTAICRNLDIRSIGYFGLRYYDEEYNQKWLSMSKSINSQVPATNKTVVNENIENDDGIPNNEMLPVFYLVVRFYAVDPCKLGGVERLMFFLQVRQDIFTRKLPVKRKMALKLTAYILQCEKGDYNGEDMSDDDFKECMCVHDWTRDEGFEDFKKDSLHLYQMLNGSSQEKCEFNFLDRVKWLDCYGVDMHAVKSTNGIETVVGLSPIGIIIFKNKEKTAVYYWPRLTKISYKSKTLALKVQDKYGDTIGVSVDCESKGSCKKLVSMLMEHHAFFTRLTSKINDAENKENKNTSSKSGSKNFLKDIGKKGDEGGKKNRNALTSMNIDYDDYDYSAKEKKESLSSRFKRWGSFNSQQPPTNKFDEEEDDDEGTVHGYDDDEDDAKSVATTNTRVINFETFQRNNNLRSTTAAHNATFSNNQANIRSILKVDRRNNKDKNPTDTVHVNNNTKNHTSYIKNNHGNYISNHISRRSRNNNYLPSNYPCINRRTDGNRPDVVSNIRGSRNNLDGIESCPEFENHQLPRALSLVSARKRMMMDNGDEDEDAGINRSSVHWEKGVKVNDGCRSNQAMRRRYPQQPHYRHSRCGEEEEDIYYEADPCYCRDNKYTRQYYRDHQFMDPRKNRHMPPMHHYQNEENFYSEIDPTFSENSAYSYREPKVYYREEMYGCACCRDRIYGYEGTVRYPRRGCGGRKAMEDMHCDSMMHKKSLYNENIYDVASLKSHHHYNKRQKGFNDDTRYYLSDGNTRSSSSSSVSKKKCKRRSKSPGLKPPQELAEHFRYVDQKDEGVVDQWNIPYTTVHTDDRLVHQNLRRRRRSGCSGSEIAALVDQSCVLPDGEGPPPYNHTNKNNSFLQLDSRSSCIPGSSVSSRRAFSVAKNKKASKRAFEEDLLNSLENILNDVDGQNKNLQMQGTQTNNDNEIEENCVDVDRSNNDTLTNTIHKGTEDTAVNKSTCSTKSVRHQRSNSN